MSEQNGLKVKIIEFSKKHPSFRKLARKLSNGKKYITFKIKGLGKKTNDKMVVFFAFKGKSYACSPKAIYEYMLTDKEYEDYQFVWAFNEPEKYQFLEKNSNTSVIKYDKKIFINYLIKAKYWITNYRVEDYIYPKKNQVYVQCWHGTPLKRLGYDLKETHNAMNSENEIHAKYKIDAKKFKYLISPSKFATEKFISAWNLKEFKKEDVIIQEGYPRNDFLYNCTSEQSENIRKRMNLPKDKKIILYAPTWRDDQHQAGIGYTYQTEIDFDSLRKNLSRDYIILFRAHYLVANSFDFEKYQGFIYNVSDIDDINELYSISDILMTDYSSVFFDYANLKKPIIFYMYDFEKYKNELRGFYIDINELPGEITKTEPELLKAISETKKFCYDSKYQEFNNKYNHLEDGNASKRVIKKII